VPTLTIVVPFYEDPAEAAGLLSRARGQLPGNREVECILLALDPAQASGVDAPPGVRLISGARYQGIPAAKNAALRAARGSMLLFLSPPLVPCPGAIASLVKVLRSRPEVGAVCGKWENSRAVVEKGYNVRAFPTLRALAYDLLFLNKLLPGNACTRRYKMHDFDHRTARPVEHALDYAFLARTELLIKLGGFDERYRFGWFEQVEMCRAIIRAGHQVRFEPSAEFSSTDRLPVIDRLLADHYPEFYFDQERYAASQFGARGAAALRVLLAAGMMVRLAFALALPGALRRRLLVRYRSYVGDGYIRSMARAYWQTLRRALMARLETGA